MVEASDVLVPSATEVDSDFCFPNPPKIPPIPKAPAPTAPAVEAAAPVNRAAPAGAPTPDAIRRAPPTVNNAVDSFDFISPSLVPFVWVVVLEVPSV